MLNLLIVFTGTRAQYVTDWRVVVDLVRAMAWPLLAACAIVILRKPLGEFFVAIGQRATKIGAMNVTLELAAATDRPATIAAPALEPLRKEAFPVQESGSSLFRSIVESGIAKDVVINIGNGDEWLTSRLFILAALLPRMRGLKCIVFCDGRDGVHFVGLARAETVRWALARAYPILEQAYVTAQSMTGAWTVLSDSGAIPPGQADQLFRSYLDTLKVPPPDPAVSDWVNVENRYHERAMWITPELLARVLDVELFTAAVDRRSANAQDGAIRVLRCDAPFVALVGPNRRFEGVVDRTELLERAGDLLLKG